MEDNIFNGINKLIISKEVDRTDYDKILNIWASHFIN